MKTEKFDSYFKQDDIITKETYSSSIVTSVVRSILEPLAKNNTEGLIFARLKNIEGTESIIKRLEYSRNVTLKVFSDFDFSKFDVEDVGFVVLTTHRYNCAFILVNVVFNKF